MKFGFALIVWTLACSALAQDAGQIALERVRIDSERAKAEADFSVRENACYQRFAVTACINQARAARRATLSDLRRQETELNDVERKRKAAERLRGIEQRQ